MPSYVRPGIRKCAKNRALSDYADGLLRMRATLSQAAGFPLSGSAIAQFPSMIKAAEKKGLCHMLVNDHKLEWVQGDE